MCVCAKYISYMFDMLCIVYILRYLHHGAYTKI